MVVSRGVALAGAGEKHEPAARAARDHIRAARAGARRVSSGLPSATGSEDKAGALVLRVTHSNSTEALALALGHRLPRDAFVKSTVVVPNRAMERVVELSLAQSTGLVANVRFARLEEWLEGLLTPQGPSDAAARRPLIGPRALLGRVLTVLVDPSLEAFAGTDDPLAPVSRYLLAGDGRWRSPLTDRRRLELAPRLAQLFSEYAYSRPDWIRAWMREGGESGAAIGLVASEKAVERWQSALYRRVRAVGDVEATTFAELVGEPATRLGAELDPSRVFVFGVSYVARVFHEALVRVGRDRDVELFVLNPCREFWSDVASRAGGRRRAAMAAQLDADGEVRPLESRLLEAWGRPGREHVGALDEAVGFDTDERFVEPQATTHLGRVQRSILERSGVEAGAHDGSLVVVPCTSVRREVETVVSLVWALVADADRRAKAEGAEPLRLNEIAILVPARDRERYLPHLEVVLEAARESTDGGPALPWSAQDLKLAARSRVAEAGLRLLAFLGAMPTRREVLGLVAHPLVRASTELEAPSERAWAALCDEVGIVRGIDERDLRGTYADRASGEGDVLHFDQGLARLAVGCARGEEPVAHERTVGERDDDTRGLHRTVGSGARGSAGTSGALERPAHLGGEVESALAFVTLVRSLLADHRAIRGAELTLRAWAELLDRVLVGYVRVVGAAEEAELERCRAAVRGLAQLDPATSSAEDAGGGSDVARAQAHASEAPRFSAEIALGLATRALEEVPAVRGEPQAMGVVLASLLPMRAIPFRAVFVLGLGEGQFPEESAELGLDLRRSARRVGDVAPEERDRYAFLETLVSTRERLFLSYVARDEHTGDPHAPSSVVTELLEAAGGALHLRPPARRHELFVEGEVRDAWRRELGAAGLADPVALAALATALGGAVAEGDARARGDVERSHFRDVELASEVWARLGPDDSRRSDLSLPRLPRAALDADRPVRLDTLRGFLRCPVQGRARHWLRGLEGDEALLVEEEPLDARTRELERLARGALEAALDRGLGDAPREALERAVREVVGEARSRGHVPVGVLGEDVAADVRTRAERWLGALHEARPGVQLARSVRLGRVSADRSRGEQHVEVRGALALEAVPPPPGASTSQREAAATRTVAVEGRTGALLRSAAGAPAGDLVLLLAASAVGEGERARAARGVAVLEAYLDHAVLAASGQERLSRRVLLLAGEAAYETSLPGLAKAQAARWLRGLADEIRAVEDPCWFLPAEAVVLEAETLRRGDPKLADKLARSVERVRTKLEGGSSRRGPLRAEDVIARDAPEPRDLLAIVARRHAPVLSVVRAPVRSSSGERDAAGGLLR